MKKIAVVGAPSTGKTILARRLANRLSLLGYDADNVLEYARTYLFRYIKPTGRSLQEPLDQVMIFLGQKRREADLRHCDFVICDSATFLPFVFAGHYGYDVEDPRDVMVVHKLFKWSLEEIDGYDFIAYLPPILDYEPREDGFKKSTGDDRREIARRIEGFLLDQRVAYHRIEADDPEAREAAVLDLLAEGSEDLRARLGGGRSAKRN